MTAMAQRIADEALTLPSDERAALVETLLVSLNAPTSAEVEQAWVTEIERRVREIDEGKVVPVDGEHVFAELRSKYAR